MSHFKRVETFFSVNILKNMNSKAFWWGCLPFRLFVAFSAWYIIANLPIVYIRELLLAISTISIGLLALAVFPRLRPNAPEAAWASPSGKDFKVWWAHPWRGIHSAVWGTCAIIISLYLIYQNDAYRKNTAVLVSLLLSLDAILAVVAVLNK